MRFTCSFVLITMFSLLFSTLTFADHSDNFCFNGDIPEAQEDLSAMCLTAPIIICPSTYLGCPGDDLSTANTGVATAQPGDANCPQPTLTFTDTIVMNTPCLVIVHRMWEASYPPGSASIKLHSSCQQTLYLEDTQDPVLSACPSDIVVNLSNSNCDRTVSWTAPTATDDCGIDALTSTHSSGASFPDGTTTVTYTAEDACGNRDNCSFSVTITGSCCGAPNISCPRNYFGCPDESDDPSITGQATASASDQTCGDPIVAFSDQTTTSGSCNNRVIVRTWTATDPDDSSLVGTCSQNIRLSDTQEPTIQFLPQNISITVQGNNNCSGTASWAEPFATDNCGINSLTSSHASGSVFFEGTTTVTYTAIDNCGNQETGSFTVTVTCSSGCDANPTITCPRNFFDCPGVSTDPNTTGTATATAGSNLCGTPVITHNDVIVSNGTSSCAGAIRLERTWTATDPDNANLRSTCVQIIRLDDTQDPSLRNLPTNITVNATGAGCSAPATWSQPIFTDNCRVTSVTSSHNSGDIFSEGTTTVTYTGFDACGNSTTGSFTVTVVCGSSCTTPPVISCPSAYVACPTAGIPQPSITGHASGAPGGPDCPNPIITYNDIIVDNGPCTNAKHVSREWKATNPNNTNLFSKCTQTISLQDNQNPTISNCPTGMTLTANGGNCTVNATWNRPRTTDNCSNTSLVARDQNGNVVTSGMAFAEGNHVITYRASDACGNEANCSFTITVNCLLVCDTAPGITCPSDMTVCTSSDVSPNTLGNAIAAGGANCPTPVLNYTDQVISNGNCGDRIFNRIWIASYPSGSSLTASCIQRVTLEDNADPILQNCPSDITVNSLSTVVTWSAPTAVDNCGTPHVTSNYAPGQPFPAGTTNVTYTATDACGNSTSCTFKVSVYPPGQITCPNDLYLSCNGNGGAVAQWAEPTYSGVCGDCHNTTFIPGFIYMGTFNGNQYYCSTSPATWANAQGICEQNGGYLASIGSAAENHFLAEILTIQSAWIGLNDHAYEGQYTWANGDAMTYSNWYPGQPNDYNGNQDCVEMLNNGEWNDQYCSYELEFIMEKPCSFIQQISGPQSGTFLTGGNYTVTYAINDACGSTETCSFDIIVEDALSMTCPNNIVTSAEENTAGVAVNWAAPSVTSCCSDCSNGGQAISGFIYMGSLNGHHYYCSNDPATWQAAQANCQANGGHLAVINNATENAFLANILTLQSAWIGLSDAGSEGNFSWVNGQPLSYTNWYPGQPNNYNGSQDYVEMLNTGLWNDQYNHYALEYIMEISDCVNISQVSGPAPGSVLAPGSSHTVTYQATDGCGNSETCSFSIVVNETPAPNGCDSRGLNSDCYHISGVAFGTISNKSGNDGGYRDFTNRCTYVSPGNSYPLHLAPGFSCGAAQKVYWKVWIDFNLDGDYDDAHEYVAYGCSANTLSGTLTMPYTLWNGQTTMRVAMKYGSYPKSPCETFQYGEVEDYCINVINAGDFTGDDPIEGRSFTEDNAELLTVDSAREMSVYPNPASKNVNIELSNLSEVNTIQLYSTSGQLITEQRPSDSEIINMDVSRYDVGLYLLRVIYNDGDVKTEKLSITR